MTLVDALRSSVASLVFVRAERVKWLGEEGHWLFQQRQLRNTSASAPQPRTGRNRRLGYNLIRTPVAYVDSGSLSVGFGKWFFRVRRHGK